jgi:nitrate/TMAO reductase-like tetraheme cytochrome c subunit
MYEGSITPGAHRPRPLTKKELRELQARLEWASERIEKIREREALEKKKKGIDSPEWV